LTLALPARGRTASFRRALRTGVRYALVPYRAARAWVAHRCTTHAAALAYYAMFSLAPILVIAVSISGLVFGQDAVQGRLVAQIEGLLGHDGACLVQRVIEASCLSGKGGGAGRAGGAGGGWGAGGRGARWGAAVEGWGGA
jgi:membrane protein